MALHDLGNEPESRAALTALTERFGSSKPYHVAVAHAWRGEHDDAFDWLDRAYAARAWAMTELGGELRLRKLRGDPRFTALLRKMSMADLSGP